MKHMGPETEELIRLDFFTDIGKAIASATTVSETLDQVMDKVVSIFAPRNWSVLLRQPKSGDLKFVTVTGSAGPELTGKILPRGKGIAGWIAENGQPVIIEDVSKDSRFSPEMDQLADFKTKSIIGVPLKTRQQVFGVIELVNKLNGEAFTPLDLRLLMTIADFAAIAIEKAYYLKALRKMASLDPLTGLLNRRSFHRNLEKEQERSRRSNIPFALMMVDIDEFKRINDTLGHKEGDEVLKLVARILDTQVRKEDSVYRYGGDEFMVMMPHSRRKEAEVVRDRIRRQLEKENNSRSRPIGLSIGLHSSAGEDDNAMLELVDRDMYREKRQRQEQTIEDLPANIQDFWDEDEMELKNKILEALKVAGEPLSAKQMADRTGLDEKDVEKGMKKLKEEDRIESPKRNYWALKA